MAYRPVQVSASLDIDYDSPENRSLVDRRIEEIRNYSGTEVPIAAPLVTKRCQGRCGRDLGLDDYHKNTDSKDGRQTRCKNCLNDRARNLKSRGQLRKNRTKHS